AAALSAKAPDPPDSGRTQEAGRLSTHAPIAVTTKLTKERPPERRRYRLAPPPAACPAAAAAAAPRLHLPIGCKCRSRREAGNCRGQNPAGRDPGSPPESACSRREPGLKPDASRALPPGRSAAINRR